MKLIFVFVVCLFGIVAAVQPATYCINLAKDAERRSHMEEVFQAASLENVNWVGIDGASADLSQYSFVTEDIKEKLLTGEIGALVSHISVWKQIAESDDEISLVFEDDIVLPADFSSQLETVYSELPEDWNIMYLSYLKAWEFKRPQKVSEHLVRPNWPLGFYAYALSPSGAQALLDLVEEGIVLPNDCVDCGIDAVVAGWIHEEKATAYAANPEICYNSFAFSSTIGVRDARIPRDMLEAMQTGTSFPTPPSPSSPSPSPPSPAGTTGTISSASALYPMGAAIVALVVAALL